MLALYPAPNVDGGGGYNYETTTVVADSQDNFQSRVNHGIGNRDRCSGRRHYQRTSTEDGERVRIRRCDEHVEPRHVDDVVPSVQAVPDVRIRYQFLRQTNVHAALRRSRKRLGRAGIDGNNQDPVNWGPPALVFSSGIAGLATGQYNRQEKPHPWVLVGSVLAYTRRA